MQKTLVLGLVAMLVVFGGWLLWKNGETAVRAREVAVAAHLAAAAHPEAAVPIEVASPSPTHERIAVPAEEPARAQCTLRGRCVDVAGQPIAGVNADLTGWGGNGERVAEWRKNNGEPERVREKLTTGPDGRFEFRFWPPPPFQFALRLTGAGVATWSERWNELAAGATKDLGDVKLERATLLRGRVVETDGVPVAKVEVRVNAVARERRDSGTERWTDGRTSDDGTFVCRWALAAGEYELGIDGRDIERPRRVTLAGDGGEQVIEVVLKKLDAADAIRGVVVDQHGAPVQGATILNGMGGRGRINQTDREGRFRVSRPEGAPAKVPLFVQGDDFDVEPSPGPPETYAWGRSDVRLVVRKAQGFVVTVVRAADGTPVEDYVLRVMPNGGGFHSSNDSRARGANHHEGGRETVDGVRIGTHHVMVEPIGDELSIGIVPIEVGAASTPPVVVRLAANVPRTVRVQLADGTPVVGAKVQLVDPLGEPLTDKLTVCAIAQWGYTTAKKALELAAALTDARGECTLRAPADRPLGLNLPGPVHAPLLVPVVFPAAGPFVVTVSQGACLKGTIGPATAIAEIRRLAGITDKADPGRARWPSIYLTRNAPDRVRFPELRDRKTMRSIGTFEIAGVPPGRWNVLVQCFRQNEDGRGGNYLEELWAEVDLVAGQTTTVALDLSSMLPGELEGLVLHNGAPLATTRLHLLCPLGQVESGEQQTFTVPVTTDGEGRFRTTVRGGEGRLSWARPRGESWSTLHASERAVVQQGQLTQQTFTLQSGTVKLRLLDAAGAGVGRVAIELRDEGGLHRQALGPTDDAGRVAAECEIATFTAWVLPKRLQEQKALNEFYQAHRGEPDPMATVRLQLGTVTTRMGETVELELRLPAAWEK